jgi:hypothetical protein
MPGFARIERGADRQWFSVKCGSALDFVGFWPLADSDRLILDIALYWDSQLGSKG